MFLFRFVSICLCSLSLFSLLATPQASAQVLPPTATPIPANMLPDQCEENDSLVQPCAIPTEIEIGDLTFVDDAIDVYSAILKGGRTYTIRASSSDGIDPTMTLFLAGASEQPLMQNDDAAAGSPEAIMQFTSTSDAWYLVQVENRAPGNMKGRSYQISIRSSTIAHTSTAQPTAMPGDAYENNYDLNHAATLAWAVPYDLSLLCPELRADACPSGDHDFFLVPVKRGLPFVALTYDLGPGSDTILTLYAPEAGTQHASNGIQGWRAVQGNDDALPDGRTLRSQLMFTPSWDGEVLLVVASSQRKDPPRLPETAGPPGRYRLIVGSPALPSVQEVLQAQEVSQVQQKASQPAQESVSNSAEAVSSTSQSSSSKPQTGAVVATTSPAPGAIVVATAAVGTHGDMEEIIREGCITGKAMVVNSTGARLSAAAVPSNERRVLMVYPEGSIVSLLGSCYLGWVKVLPQDSVTPGWMFAPDLRLLEGQQAAHNTSENDVPDSSNINSVGASTPAAVKSMQIAVLPTLVATTTPGRPHTAFNLTLRVVDENDQPRIGLRIWLSNALGDVLREGITDSHGQLTLSFDVASGTAMWVQIPSAGLSVAINQNQPAMTITIPH